MYEQNLRLPLNAPKIPLTDSNMAVINRWKRILMLISHIYSFVAQFSFLCPWDGLKWGRALGTRPGTLKMKIIWIWACHTSLDAYFDAHFRLWNFLALFLFFGPRELPKWAGALGTSWAEDPKNESYPNMTMSYIVGCGFWCSYHIMKFCYPIFTFWPLEVAQMGRGPGHQLGRRP